MTRKKAQLRPDGKFNGAALTHMREVAFGADMTSFIDRVVNTKQRHVDKMDAITAAERKRLRKLELNKKRSTTCKR